MAPLISMLYRHKHHVNMATLISMLYRHINIMSTWHYSSPYGISVTINVNDTKQKKHVFKYNATHEFVIT